MFLISESKGIFEIRQGNISTYFNLSRSFENIKIKLEKDSLIYLYS